MSRRAEDASVHVVSAGAVAREALARGGAGTVTAVFERCCYASLPGGWLCVGEASLCDGPINLRCVAGRGHAPGFATLSPGQSVHVCGDRLWLGALAVAGLAEARVWRPRPPPVTEPARLRRGLAALASSLAAMPAAGGLAALDANAAPSGGTWLRAAAAPVGVIRGWLGAGAGAPVPVDAVTALLGLGPGLTPSGDDFLAGLMVALHKLRRAQALARLRGVLLAQLATATHALSAAHLAAAARGAAVAPLDGLLDAVLRGDAARVTRAWPALLRHGHSSGRDALAQALGTRRDARREARNPPPRRPG